MSPQLRQLLLAQRQALIELGREAIGYALVHGQAPAPDLAAWPDALAQPGACFVTLECDGQLRGCIGSIEARRPLLVDLVENAVGAALRDSRFDPVRGAELEQLELSLAVLGPLEALEFPHSQALPAILRPHRDGLVLAAGERRGVFLPKVWDKLPEPIAFISQLRRKAGLAANCEPPQLRAWRFAVLEL